MCVLFTYKNPKYLLIGDDDKIVYSLSHLFANSIHTVFTNKFKAVAICDNIYDDICKYKINVQQLLDAIDVGKTSELVELKMEFVILTYPSRINKTPHLCSAACFVKFESAIDKFPLL